MSALYVMRYLGESDTSAGVLYIGKGIVVGVDTGNIRYRGTYTQSEGRLRADVTNDRCNGWLNTRNRLSTRCGTIASDYSRLAGGLREWHRATDINWRTTGFGYV